MGNNRVVITANIKREGKCWRIKGLDINGTQIVSVLYTTYPTESDIRELYRTVQYINYLSDILDPRD